MDSDHIKIIGGNQSYTLDLRAKELYREGSELVKLTRTPWELLLFFVEQKPRALIKKDLLAERVWRASVGDETIVQTVSVLRKALLDTRATPDFIETVHRDGYRFIAQAVRLPENNDHSPEGREVATGVEGNPPSSQDRVVHNEVAGAVRHPSREHRVLLGNTSFDETEPGTSDWRSENAEPLQRGLAELFVHPPLRGGNLPNMFQLRISLSFAEYPDHVEGRDVTLALSDAVLQLAYQRCRPEPGTRIGEEGNVHSNLDFKAGNWRVKGPRLPNNNLEGEPLGQEPLCTINADADGDNNLTITLRSRYRDLVVVPDEHGANTLKSKVLQLLLQKCQPKDLDGFVTWGRASLRRKQRDEADR